jgi:phosphoribosylanthranilate isomerase
MLKIKVCGMKDPFNVKEIGEARPDFMGFIFYPPSPRYVGDKPDMSLFLNVPAGIEKVGVFVDSDRELVVDIAESANIEIVQLHGDESPDYCGYLKSLGLKVIKTFNVKDIIDFKIIESYSQVCDYFLFDTETGMRGGSGRKFSWDKLSGYIIDKPFFLSGGIGPEDNWIIKVFKTKGLFGVDVNSRFETAPGMKDVNLVKSFINEIRNEQI